MKFKLNHGLSNIASNSASECFLRKFEKYLIKMATTKIGVRVVPLAVPPAPLWDLPAVKVSHPDIHGFRIGAPLECCPSLHTRKGKRAYYSIRGQHQTKRAGV